MATVTGIELGPESCVLVRVRTGREPQLSAARVIEAGEWPSHDVAATEMLARVKRELRLPRRARIIVWGAPDSANVSDLASLVALRPIVAAGFKIDSIISPPKALALLAASRARRGAVGAQAWLALNCHGAAIAIVRQGELLLSRTFGWNYGSPFGGPNAQLLQRYSLVAHLAPEVRHAIDMVAESHGVTVELVVTCGDLPELRSLTMPLIEELDIEVETLDSTEGLSVSPQATGDRIAESASALRLACAAAGGPRTVARRWAIVAPSRRAAAVVAVVGGLAWLGYRQWLAPAPARVTPVATVVRKTAQPQSAPVSGRPTAVAPSVYPARPTGAPPEVPSSARVEPRAAPPAIAAPAPTSAVRSAAPPTVTPAPPSAVRSALPPAVTPAPTSIVTSAPPQPAKPIANPTTPPAVRPTPPVVASAAPPAAAKPAPSASSGASTTAPAVGKPAFPPVAKVVPPAPQAVATTAQSPLSKPTSTAPRAVPPTLPTAADRPAPSTATAVVPKSVPPRVTPPATALPPVGTIASRPADPAPPRTTASKPAAPRISGSAPPAATSAPPTAPPFSPPQPSAPPFVVPSLSQPGESAVKPLPSNPGVTARYAPPRPSAPPVPLKTPVPAVNSILVSPDRRLAVLDGAIVGVGDAVGLRVVVQIEPEAVILREPSGHLIRVSIRGRQVGNTPLP